MHIYCTFALSSEVLRYTSRLHQMLNNALWVSFIKFNACSFGFCGCCVCCPMLWQISLGIFFTLLYLRCNRCYTAFKFFTCNVSIRINQSCCRRFLCVLSGSFGIIKNSQGERHSDASAVFMPKQFDSESMSRTL